MKHLLFCFILLSSPSRSGATTVILSDGSTLKGAIQVERPDTVFIETHSGRLGIPRNTILHPDSAAPALTRRRAAELQPSFGEAEDRVTSLLILETLGEQAAEAYSAMQRNAKTGFLDRLWSQKSPLLRKYYYDYHLGRRHFTISPSYFERGNLIPSRYRSGFPAHHPDDIRNAIAFVQHILDERPDDLIAQSAMGYLKLEADEFKEARKLFENVLRKDRKFIEARNGRALAYLKMHHQKAKALEQFRETVAMDREYVGAIYAMGMCHTAMMGQDRIGLDDYLRKVIAVDPDHEDAWFKLGAFNEALRRTERAAEAYSRQLAVNPNHARASERLAQVSMMLRSEGKARLTHEDLVRLAERDSKTYLPLLAESFIDREDYLQAEAAYERYLQQLSPVERAFYEDLSLIAKPETVETIETAYPRQERHRLRRRFWVLADPTPTTPVNERRVEHHRRVTYARANFSDGLDRLSGLGWDSRGDIYIRFGPPDHRSWSDFLVFETDPDVARVKSRINDLAHSALEEVLPPQYQHGSGVSGAGSMATAGVIRGIPTFPLPRRTTIMRDGVETGYEWECWIYGSVGGGIEVTFIDEIGKGFYEFARVPPESPHRMLWQAMSPATVVGRIISREPSTYVHDHGGGPMDLFVSTAGFRGRLGRTNLEIYLGIPVSQLFSTESAAAVVDREVAIYDRDWKIVHRSTDQLSHTVDDQTGVEESLMIDLVKSELRPGPYFLAIQVQQPVSRDLQIYRSPITVGTHTGSAGKPGLSDLEVAAEVTEVSEAERGKFQKQALRVVPLPTGQASTERPVSLYFEIYGLRQDTFGRTRYRVDYAVESGTRGHRIVSSLGRLIGKGPQDLATQVSYEHEGDTADEQMHASLALPDGIGRTVRVTVHVTDLQSHASSSPSSSDLASPDLASPDLASPDLASQERVSASVELTVVR